MAEQTSALVLIGGRGSRPDRCSPGLGEARALGALMHAAEIIELHPTKGTHWGREGACKVTSQS